MNTSDAKSNWTVKKGKLKQRFAILTNDPLLLEEGKKEEILGNLEILNGQNREVINNNSEAN